jgi:hypothetical protein
LFRLLETGTRIRKQPIQQLLAALQNSQTILIDMVGGSASAVRMPVCKSGSFFLTCAVALGPA